MESKNLLKASRVSGVERKKGYSHIIHILTPKISTIWICILVVVWFSVIGVISHFIKDSYFAGVVEFVFTGLVLIYVIVVILPTIPTSERK